MITIFLYKTSQLRMTVAVYNLKRVFDKKSKIDITQNERGKKLLM